MLTGVNVKNKGTCVDVERFKHMFANSKHQGAPKAREKKRPLHAVSGNINHRVPR